MGSPAATDNRRIEGGTARVRWWATGVAHSRKFMRLGNLKFLYLISGMLVIGGFLLWYNFNTPPINSNIGFDLYPSRQVALALSPFNPYLWPGSSIPWTLGLPTALYYGGFLALSGDNTAVALFLCIAVLDVLGAISLCFLASVWLKRFGFGPEFALAAVLIYTFNAYRLLSGFGTSDGYLSGGILTPNDPAVLLILTALTYLTLFRHRVYALLLGFAAFWLFGSFPIGTLTLFEEYGAVVLVLLAFYLRASMPSDWPARARRLAGGVALTAGPVLVANAYLALPAGSAFQSYVSGLVAPTSQYYATTYSFDTTETPANAIRLATNWALYSWRAPPWVGPYLSDPASILLSCAVPLLAFAAVPFIRRLSDQLLYAAMVGLVILSASINSPFGGAFVWATTNVLPLRAFYNGETFSSPLLITYCFFATLTIAGVPRWIRGPAPYPISRVASLRAVWTATPRHRRLIAKTWPWGVAIIVVLASYPALTPAFSQSHADGEPLDSNLPGYYPAASSYLSHADPNGPTMVFPEVEPFDSNALNGTAWYTGVNIYPDIIHNPSISSALSANYVSPVPAPINFVYDMGGSVCSDPVCTKAGVDPVPNATVGPGNDSVDYASPERTLINWSSAFETDSLSFASENGTPTMSFDVNASVFEVNGHWAIGYLANAQNFSQYNAVELTYSLSGANSDSVYFGFHSYTDYGPGRAYALGGFPVVSNGTLETVLIPLAEPTIATGAELTNVTNLFFVDQSNGTTGTARLSVGSLEFVRLSDLVAPLWEAGTPGDSLTLHTAPGVDFSFQVNTSTFLNNGHWALGYYPAPTNLTAFSFVILHYTLKGLDPAYVQFGFHSGVDYGPGRGYYLSQYLTFQQGETYTTYIPLSDSTIDTGGSLTNVTNLFVTYSPLAQESEYEGTGYLNVSTIRLAPSDPEPGEALASDLARLGIEFAYVDTSIVSSNSPGYLGTYYDTIFATCPFFHEVFHAGTVTIFRNLAYDGLITSPARLAPFSSLNATVGGEPFYDIPEYYNSSNLGVSYVPQSLLEAGGPMGAANVSGIEETAPTTFTADIAASAPAVIELATPFSTDWEAESENGTPLLDHFVVNGYANGWLAPPGQYRVLIVYSGAATYAGVELVTLLVPPSMLALFVVFVIRRRTGARHSTLASTDEDRAAPDGSSPLDP
jgi:hypothetical protein